MDRERGGTSTMLAGQSSPNPNMTDESDTRENVPNDPTEKIEVIKRSQTPPSLRAQRTQLR